MSVQARTFRNTPSRVKPSILLQKTIAEMPPEPLSRNGDFVLLSISLSKMLVSIVSVCKRERKKSSSLSLSQQFLAFIACGLMHLFEHRSVPIQCEGHL